MRSYLIYWLIAVLVISLYTTQAKPRGRRRKNNRPLDPTELVASGQLAQDDDPAGLVQVAVNSVPDVQKLDTDAEREKRRERRKERRRERRKLRKLNKLNKKEGKRGKGRGKNRGGRRRNRGRKNKSS